MKKVSLGGGGVGEVVERNTAGPIEQNIGSYQISEPTPHIRIPLSSYTRYIGSGSRDTQNATERAAGSPHSRDGAVKIAGIQDNACNPLRHKMIVVSGMAPKAHAGA